MGFAVAQPILRLLLVDMATLTGAARVALGPELAALFCNDEALARSLLDAAEAEADPMWRMPLWRPYRKIIDSKIADLNNVSESPHAGAITAALYLQEFVEPDIPWGASRRYGLEPAEPSRPPRRRGGHCAPCPLRPHLAPVGLAGGHRNRRFGALIKTSGSFLWAGHANGLELAQDLHKI
jgi:hypothetical protein